MDPIEEENKRLGRMIVEAQTDRGGAASGDHMLRVQGELKDLRVEHKKIEADHDRLVEQYAGADRDRSKLESRLAQIEVELQEAVHGRLAAESARNVAQDALAKAEGRAPQGRREEALGGGEVARARRPPAATTPHGASSIACAAGSRISRRSRRRHHRPRPSTTAAPPSASCARRPSAPRLPSAR